MGRDVNVKVQVLEFSMSQPQSGVSLCISPKALTHSYVSTGSSRWSGWFVDLDLADINTYMLCTAKGIMRKVRSALSIEYRPIQNHSGPGVEVCRSWKHTCRETAIKPTACASRYDLQAVCTEQERLGCLRSIRYHLAPFLAYW